MSKRTLGVIVLFGLSVSAGAALAQSNPSADSIINALTPHAGLGGMTRGIRPLAPSAPAAPAAMPATPAVERPVGHIRPSTTSPSTASPIAPRPPVSTAENAPSVNLTVQFANDSAELTPSAMHTLDELGRALSSNALANYHFRIEGHTDKLGAPNHNQALSERRAQAVVSYLTARFHVDAARLQPVGMGESSPLVPTGENVAEPRNRRVTVINVGA